MRADMSVPALMDHLRRGRVNGIILPTPLSQSEELLAALRADNIPVVTVAATRNRPDAYSVSIDDYQAARAMTAYLIEMGHRRIGFIKGNPDHGSAERRYLGYLAALDEAGIELDLALVGQGLYTYRSGLMAADAMLTIANRPTAIFASNDDMAAATIATAHMMRLHVPGDLTVCGCDDTPLATTIWPELTTIRLPISDMARAGVNMLAEAIRSRKKPAPVKHELFDYTLVRRQSDAPPSAVSQISR
jgi:LacI family transcriptional regulator